MAKNGTFKADLLQRLNVIPLALPPLRERTSDVSLLIDTFQKNPGYRILQFPEPTLNCLKNYSWPGNIRELNNLLEYLQTMSESEIVHVEDLPSKFWNLDHMCSGTDQDCGPYYQKLHEYERTLLTTEYRRFEGNVSQLARALKMDPSHLYTKLKAFGLR